MTEALQIRTKRPTARALIDRQAQVFADIVGSHVARGQPYALLDFPQHFNIGDSAIYMGELAFFDRHVGRRASCVCTWGDAPEALKHQLPDGPIFLHGGGNFGDLWINHQDFRLRVLKLYPGHKIVQLPQSIHFDSIELRDETARRIEAHGNFTLLVRDRQSLDFARAHFPCEVQLCPDAATMLGGWRDDTAPQRDVQVMLRGDKEAVTDERHAWLKAQYPNEDWVDVPVWPIPLRIGWKIARSLPDNRLAMRWREGMFRWQATQRVRGGLAQLGQARLIVTDRLHMHLLSSLIGRRHLVLDNSYGKIARYIEAWGQDDLTERIGSVAELREVMQQKITVR